MKVKSIGLTGGIGSGKTYVAAIFQMMGIPIYNSDEKAKTIMTRDLEVINALKKEFGNEVYTEKGELNKKLIADQIFHHKNKLNAINNIVHPAVRKDFQKWSQQFPDADYVINEAALFIENGAYATFDALISVLSPVALRILRIKERDNISEEEILARINIQSSDIKKLELSDFIIFNDKVESLFQQCSKIHQSIIKNKF